MTTNVKKKLFCLSVSVLLILLVSGCPNTVNGNAYTITGGSLKIPNKLTFEFGENIPALDTWEIILNYSNGMSEVFKYSDHINDLTLDPTADKINEFISGTGGRDLQISVTYNKSENFVPITATLTVNRARHSWKAGASFVATWDKADGQEWSCEAALCEVNPSTCEEVKFVDNVGSVAIKSKFSEYRVDLELNDSRITNTKYLGFGGFNPKGLTFANNVVPDTTRFEGVKSEMTVHEGLDIRWRNSTISDGTNSFDPCFLTNLGGTPGYYFFPTAIAITIDKKTNPDYIITYVGYDDNNHSMLFFNFVVVAVKDDDLYAMPFFKNAELSYENGTIDAGFGGKPIRKIDLSVIVDEVVKTAESDDVAEMLKQEFDWYLVVRDVINDDEYTKNHHWVYRNVIKINDVFWNKTP